MDRLAKPSRAGRCLARRRPVEFRSVILAAGLTADSDADHAIGNAASCAGSSPTGSCAAALVEQDSKAHTALGERSKKGPQGPDFRFLAVQRVLSGGCSAGTSAATNVDLPKPANAR